jgi:hypothetical protein
MLAILVKNRSKKTPNGKNTLAYCAGALTKQKTYKMIAGIFLNFKSMINRDTDGKL